MKTALQVAKECNPLPNSTKECGLKAKNSIFLSPRSIGVTVSINDIEIKDKPLIGRIQQEPIKYIPIINPRSILPLVEDQWKRHEVGLPAAPKEEIEAARLIVIRKKKMRKHKRNKLWKRMRHRWARVSDILTYFLELK